MKHQARHLPLINSCRGAPSTSLFFFSRRPRLLAAGLAALLITAATPVSAQTVAPGAQDAKNDLNASDELIELSPFVVEATADDDSYRANSTLAGTRVRTDLSDVASSISVVTSQFMKDTAATNNQTLLQYTTNTEVGGAGGNFAAVGGTFVEGAREGNFVNPNQNTRIRGLDSADNTRDYFLTDIPWDSFNVGRVDIQRGPNSILFGVGSPAGIINASVNSARMKDGYEAQLRVGSYGSLRMSADVNQVIVPRQLAVRVAWLDDDTKYRQDPAYNHDKRLFGALRFEPELLKRGSARTAFRANYEHGEVDANRPRVLPPIDQITPFFNPGAINKTAFDPYYAYLAGIGAGTTTHYLGETENYWVTLAYPGQQYSAEPRFYYDGLLSGTPAILATQKGPSGQGPVTRFALGPTGSVDQAIGGYPYKGGGYGIATYNQFTIAANKVNPALYPGAASGFYKSYTLSDPRIFDFYNHLLDGPNKAEAQQWDTFNVAMEQTFFNNRLGFELVLDHQRYDETGVSNGIGNTISVDINANSVETMPWAYGPVTKYNGSGQAGTNPNAGRAYVGTSGAGGGSKGTERTNYRATVYGELRAEDFMRKSLATDIIGRHLLTGLYSSETYEVETRSWVRYALAGEWDNLIGTGSGPDGSGMSDIRSGSRLIPLTVYISEPLFNKSLSSGLDLKPITTAQSPSGSVNIRYFDSHWKWPTNPSDPAYVNPAASWTNPAAMPGPVASTQSENPANYAGWKSTSVKILNADKGDIDSLYNGANKLRQKNTAEGLTWQGFLWGDTVVGTFGWRRDEQVLRSGVGQISPVTGAVDPHFELAPEESTVRGISRSWGVVVHQPKSTRDLLPWGTKLSLTYSNGENSRVENRYGFDGSKLPNAKGSTKDYGFMVSTLQDRLNLKVVWYETTVKDANISSTLSSESSLGATAAGVWQYTKWALGSAMQGIAGMAGDPAANGFGYLWNWAQAAEPNNTALADVNSDAFKNHPQTIKEKAAIEAFLANMPAQSFWDAYGIPVNVAAAKAHDYKNAIGGWKVSQGNWEIGGNQNINGVPPTGSVDNVSKGIEIELVGKVTENWNVALNASKQQASQTALGQQFMDFVEAQAAFYASPAGDMRLWWGGDERVGNVWDRAVGAAYRFQKETNGKMVPEMSPWRFNIATTYAFDHGFLKGANIGGAYRWQQGQILGYALKPDFSNLDVNKPYWGESDAATDLWIGYERKLTKKIRWRVQLNLRNVGQKVDLVPISVQPDGSPAMQRIQDGQTWALTNTLTF